jgi:hypothetical protein
VGQKGKNPWNTKIAVAIRIVPGFFSFFGHQIAPTPYQTWDKKTVTHQQHLLILPI